MTNKCAWATTRCVKLYQCVYLCLTKQWQSCVIMTTCYGTLVRSCIMCKDNCVSGTAGVCFPITQNFQVFFNGSVENNTYYFYNKAVWFVSLLFLLNLYNYNVVRFWLSTTMPFDYQTLSRGNQMAQLLERAQSNSVACTMKILFYVFSRFPILDKALFKSIYVMYMYIVLWKLTRPSDSACASTILHF